jgi:ABC-type multidrug transport system fused ATPase/permease subunit
MKNIVNEFYKYKIIEDDSKKIKKIEKDIESIEIKNLFFSYPNSKHYVLRNLNFILNKNECVGIIGGSGEGKSTLIDLVLGLFSPSKGEVLVNNLKFPLHQSYVDKIGYVPQDVYLTDDTIKNNIALGVAEDLIDEKKINKIIKVLKLEQLVSESKYGLNTLVGNRGVKLSGGQRQRIGIARAFYKESQVIILDEATNALDLKTEKEIISYVINNKKDKIIIIINHRTDMLKDCDKIISVEKGEIVEKK